MIKKAKNWMVENKLIMMLMVVYFFIRLPFLDQLNLLHDERDISLSGYSIAKTGKDLSGNFLPLKVVGIAPDNPIVSIYYSALWWLVIPTKSVFNARLPYVAISTLLLPLIYSFILLVHRNKKIAFMSTIICCFSPWIYYIARLGMDVTLAFVTLLIALLCQLKNKNKIAYLFYILTFYNYQGFRILIPPLILYLYLFTDKIKFTKKLVIHVMFITLLLASILFIDKDVSFKRVNQVVFLNTIFFDNQIIFNRNTSLASPVIKPIFDNKITAPINYVLSAFIKGLDQTFLFKDGDYSVITGSISGGLFFLPFIALYYLGFISIGKKPNKNSFYILGLIPIGMLPALVSLSGISFGIRGILSSVGFSFIMANGASYAYEFIKTQKNRIVYYGIPSIFFLCLLLSIANFFYVFLCRRPILAGEFFNDNERTLSQLLLTNNVSLQKVYSNNKNDLYRSYLFFNNKKQNITPQFFSCPEFKSGKENNTIKIISSGCVSEKKYPALITNTKVKKIWFSDYSTKAAYFIFE